VNKIARFEWKKRINGLHPIQGYLWRGGFAKVVAVQRRKYQPQVSFVQTGIANITASPMKISMPWSDTAVMESKN
jgi:hypothetical protein